MDLHDDLDTYAEYPDEPDAPIALHGEDDANRLLRRRTRLLRELQSINDLARAEMDRITHWQTDRSDGVRRQAQYAEDALEDYMRAVHRRDGITSLTLPNGRLQLRKASQSVYFTDEPAFVQWAKAISWEADDQTHELVEVTEHARKTGIRSMFRPGPVVATEDGTDYLAIVDGNGEVVPGVEFRRATEPSFSIPTPKEENPSE